jgi:uncharacterized protein YdeI (YjbR/CyaY-like superfamily)
MTPQFFKNQFEFRKWLDKNHNSKTELLVGFYKVKSGKLNMTWSQSVDEALCYGWIDGIRKSIDEESYCIRFTPRRPTSNWSAINIKKVEELTKNGLMQSAGLEIFRLGRESKSNIYAYGNVPVKLSDEFEKIFKSNKKAWDFFQTMPPSYRKQATNWIMSAKREETRIKRLNTLIADSEAGNKIKQLNS